MPAEFVLRLFGALTLESASGRLTRFATKRSALILGRLAVAEHNRVGRNELAALLWPDDHLEQTRLRLRQELVRLRRSVGEFGRFIRADRQWVEIEPDAMTTDAQMFDEALARSFDAKAPEQQAAFLREAVACLSGPFLAGHQEPWVLAMRRTYEEKARTAWLAFANATDALGESEAALEATYSAVRHDPMDQDANTALVRRLVERGQMARARQVFNEFDAMIYREFGVRSAASVRAALAPVTAQDVEAPARTSEPVTRPGPIYGRRAELGAIEAALDRPGCRVVLLGVPGAGKTHLLRESVWAFSRLHGLPVRFGGEPDPVPDGLFVLESAKGREWLIDTASRNGWRVLAESRGRLESGDVAEIYVEPLPVPSPKDPPDVALVNPCLQFLRSAIEAHPTHPATPIDVATLSNLARILDGLPSALKFFAARLVTQSPTQVLRDADDTLREFASRAGETGESLSDSMGKMVAELPAMVLEAFYALAALRDASPELAERLAPEGSSSAVWQTLASAGLIVVQDRGAGRRLGVPYPLAQAARARLPEELALRSSAKAWRALADWAFDQSRKLMGAEQQTAFKSIEAEVESLRAGMNWAIEHEPDLAAYLVAGTWRMVAARGNPARDGRLLIEAVESAETFVGPLAGEAWIGAAIVSAIAGQLDMAERAFLKSRQAFASAGYGPGLIWVELNYAPYVLQKRDPMRAAAMSKSVADRTDSPGTRALALSNYAESLALAGDAEEAIRVAEEVFAARMQSQDETARARAYGELGEIYQLAGRPEAARPLLEQGVARLRHAGIQDLLLIALTSLAKLIIDESRASELLTEAVDIARRVGSSAKLLELARLRLTSGVQRLDVARALAAVEDVFALTQDSESALELEASLDSLAVALEQFDKIDYANAVRAALGDIGHAPVNPGWRDLLSSDSHATVCVLAPALAREALCHLERSTRGT